MKSTAVGLAVALALTACGSRVPQRSAVQPTRQSSATDATALPPTEAPGSLGPGTSTGPTTSGAASPGATVPTTPGTSTAASPSASSVPPAAPVRLGIIAADRPTFERLLSYRKTLGSRPVAATWLASCAQLADVDLALVQGDACSGKPFPVLAAGPGLGDLSTTITALTSLTVDDRIKALLDHVLAPKTGTLGVVVESCAVNERAVSMTLTPLAKQKGFTVAATASVPCGRTAQGASAVAAMQANKVKQVMFVSGAAEATLVRAFTKQARAKAFAPYYGVTSAAVPSTLTDQQDRVVGVGWAPSLDTTAATSSVEINQCLRDVRHAGATQPTTSGRFATFGACDLLALADRVLRLTKGSTDPTAVRRAVRSTGRLFKAASTLDSAEDFRTRQAGPARASAFGWSSRCTCFQYAGDGFAI